MTIPNLPAKKNLPSPEGLLMFKQLQTRVNLPYSENVYCVWYVLLLSFRWQK